MRAKIRAWRRRQQSQVLFVPVSVPGSTIVSAGLRASQHPRLRMLEVRR